MRWDRCDESADTIAKHRALRATEAIQWCFQHHLATIQKVAEVSSMAMMEEYGAR